MLNKPFVSFGGSLLFSVFLFGQVPQGVTGSMDERSFPELKALVYWETVPGASAYKVYENVTAVEGQLCPTADNAYTFDTTVTENWYSDDPSPAWYLVDVNNRGGWQNRWWCYEVSAIVGNVESARSKPVQVAIGSSGYVTMRFQNRCADPVTVLPFPYSFSQMEIHLYYKDASGVAHEIPFLTNAGSTASEVEWKLPAIALDGTIVPLAQSGGSYYYTWKTPTDYVRDFFLPDTDRDKVTYSQIRVHVVKGAGTCPVWWEQSGGSYINTQGVTR